MVTDDEKRREVAELLRTASRPSLTILMHVLGVGEDGVFDRLADLIEPSCDRDALLAIAEEIGERQVWSCTAERCWSREIVNRIREACGEVVS